MFLRFLSIGSGFIQSRLSVTSYEDGVCEATVEVEVGVEVGIGVDVGIAVGVDVGGGVRVDGGVDVADGVYVGRGLEVDVGVGIKVQSLERAGQRSRREGYWEQQSLKTHP